MYMSAYISMKQN